MKVNGKEYSYSRVIDYSFNEESTEVNFDEVKIVGDDLLLHDNSFYYPEECDEKCGLKLSKNDDFMIDCLIVIKNYKVLSSFFEVDYSEPEYVECKFLNLIKYKKKVLNRKKICYPVDINLIEHCSRNGIYLYYDNSKKELLITNEKFRKVENKDVKGVDCLVLSCDEIAFYWNGSYLSSLSSSILKTNDN